MALIARRNGKTDELSREQLRSVFDSKAQRRLGMSGDEFLRRLDSGTLPDDPAVDEIAILVGGDER
jgi:hypothetical protein